MPATRRSKRKAAAAAAEQEIEIDPPPKRTRRSSRKKKETKEDPPIKATKEKQIDPPVNANEEADPDPQPTDDASEPNITEGDYGEEKDDEVDLPKPTYNSKSTDADDPVPDAGDPAGDPESPSNVDADPADAIDDPSGDSENRSNVEDSAEEIEKTPDQQPNAATPDEQDDPMPSEHAVPEGVDTVDPPLEDECDPPPGDEAPDAENGPEPEAPADGKEISKGKRNLGGNDQTESKVPARPGQTNDDAKQNVDKTADEAAAPAPAAEVSMEQTLASMPETAHPVAMEASNRPPAAVAPEPVQAPPPTTGMPDGVPGLASGQPPSSSVDPSVAATVVNPESIVEERAELPALYVGKVLGKGGDMIRDLQSRSSCQINVDQNVPPGSPRIITYRGTRQAVDFAKYLVQLLCSEQMSEADLPLGNAIQKIIIIPKNAIGKIVGRGGEMVRSLQSRSQARIQIDHSGAGLDPTLRQVTLTGTNEAIVKAEEMVMFLAANPLMDAAAAIDMLVQDKSRGGVWGSGPPYPNLPNQGQNMTGYAYDGGGWGAVPPPYGVPQPVVAPYAAPYDGGAAIGTTEVEVFPASKMYMGRIIGTRGVTVNDLQARSGCDIQINQDVPHGQDCQITLRGTRQGIEMAKQMIREIIESGPNHPYAGGGPRGEQQTYGYHGGHYGQQAYGYQAQAGYGQEQYPVQAQYWQPPYQAGPPQAGYAQAGPPPHASAWKFATSPDGQIYYYNEQTGETQWEKPPGMP